MSRSSTTITAAMSQYIADNCKAFSDPEIAQQLGLSRDQVINHRRRVLGINKDGKRCRPAFYSPRKPPPPPVMRYPLEGFCAAMQSVLQMRWAACATT